MGDAPSRRAWGSLESDIMTVLWAAGEELSPAQVQSALTGADDLAYNTVQTILSRLFDKGLALRRSVGRGHVYRPAQDASAAAAAQMRSVLDGPGDRRAVLQHFSRSLDADDVALLRALLSDGGPDEHGAGGPASSP